MARRKRSRKSLAGTAAPTEADGGGEPGRFSARRKMETLLRMLRGEPPLDGLARELGVTAATLAQWREHFLAGGQSALKSRAADERDEIQRLRAKIGEITMNNELLLARCHRLEANVPPLEPHREEDVDQAS